MTPYSDLTPLRLTHDREGVSVLRYTSLVIGAIAKCEVYSANLNSVDSRIKNGPRGKAREIPLTCILAVAKLGRLAR